MNKRVSLVAVGLIACFSAHTGSGILTTNPDGAFIERLSVPEFLETEKQSELSLSKASELVIYYSSGRKWQRDFLIRKNGANYCLQAASPETTSVKADVTLPAPIGRQVLMVFELLLTKQVYAPSHGSLSPADQEGGRLIFLRVGDTGIAALVREGAMHGNRGDHARIYRDLCWQLAVLAEAHADERNELLARLDRDSAVYAADLADKRK